jgi:hypothetical protein|tara:strand:+ start:1754 stop:2005 length:252 start_codon:yes stop_codon:yes gene_type:complete
MGLKHWILGGAAAKAVRVSQRPSIVAPPGYTVTGMKHQGLIGTSWKISYIKDDQPNLRKNFSISKGTTGRTEGATDWWKFYWD